MKKVVSLLLVASMISMLGCAGRPANPVMVDQIGDNRKSCSTLETEMQGIQSQIQTLVPESDKTGKNVGLGIAGAFLIIPLFFMDLTESEKIEINAYRQRYNRLQIIASEKKCDFVNVSADPASTSAPANTNVQPVDSSKTSPARAAITPAPAAMPASDLPNPAKKLEELNTMLKKGLITQGEYDAKKTEILKNM